MVFEVTTRQNLILGSGSHVMILLHNSGSSILVSELGQRLNVTFLFLLHGHNYGFHYSGKNAHADLAAHAYRPCKIDQSNKAYTCITEDCDDCMHSPQACGIGQDWKRERC